VSVRDRLRNLALADEEVLVAVGGHLGRLASLDLKATCADGLDHDGGRWAYRKRVLTVDSSSRWAGSITKASRHQWALSRRCLLARIDSLEAGVRTVRYRLSRPIGERGSKRTPGGYRSPREWHAKSRRLACLEGRLAAARADWQAGRVRVVRGGRQLLNTRHHLAQARLTEDMWRRRWEAERWFLSADGESGKRCGNETVRVTPDGVVSIKLPAPLAHLANASHGRYVLAARVRFKHRGEEWADRVNADRAVAYRIHLDVLRGRWYLTASWQRAVVKALPLEAARAHGVIGVDTNADHFAAYRLDRHGNPVGDPHRFLFDLTGTADRRDAQIRHALTRLLHWAERTGVMAIAVEDLDFATEKTREKHGRRKRFRQLISGMPTAKVKTRLVSMAAEQGLSIIAVDPAYTSSWGSEHWRKPLTTMNRSMTRHDAAGIAIGRRALGYPIRRRGVPPRHHQSDGVGHRTVQAVSDTSGREETRPRIPGPRTRCAPPGHGVKVGDQRAQHRSGHAAERRSRHRDRFPLSDEDR
jgi:IS605 OrfB family transposase